MIEQVTPVTPDHQQSTPLLVAGRIGRSLSIAALSGFLAGLIAGGIGSRVAMRISALAAGDAQRGALTENEAVVGNITADGTIFLIIFGGFIGVLGGLLYLATRRWVADAGRWRGLMFGVLLFVMFGWILVAAENPDFRLFGPPLLNVATFTALVVLFGVLQAPLYEWLSRRLPSLSSRPAVLGSLLALAFALLLILSVVVLVGTGFREGGMRAIISSLLLGYVLVVVPVAGVALARFAGRFEGLSDLHAHAGARVATILILALPVLVGLILNVQSLTQILKPTG